MAFTKITNTGIGSTGTVLLQNLDVIGIATAGFGVSTVDVFTTGITTFSNGTDSTSTTTGALVVTGGVGIGGAANIFNNGSNICVGGLGINETIFHRGDENTAMDFPSSNDRVRFRTGGVERLTIANDGVHINVGVTTIAQELDVVGQTELDNLRIPGITTVTGDIRKPTGTYYPMLTVRSSAGAGSAALRIDNWSNASTKRMFISHKFNLDGEQRDFAINIFQKAKDDKVSFDAYAKQLANLLKSSPNSLVIKFQAKSIAFSLK